MLDGQARSALVRTIVDQADADTDAARYDRQWLRVLLLDRERPPVAPHPSDK